MDPSTRRYLKLSTRCQDFRQGAFSRVDVLERVSLNDVLRIVWIQRDCNDERLDVFLVQSWLHALFLKGNELDGCMRSGRSVERAYMHAYGLTQQSRTWSACCDLPRLRPCTRIEPSPFTLTTLPAEFVVISRPEGTMTSSKWSSGKIPLVKERDSQMNQESHTRYAYRRYMMHPILVVTSDLTAVSPC